MRSLEVEKSGIFEDGMKTYSISAQDETLEILQTIGALIAVLPQMLPPELTISIIITQFAKTKFNTAFRSFKKFYYLVHECLVTGK